MKNYWLKKKQHEGYFVNTINQFGVPIIMKRLFKEGDKIVCVDACPQRSIQLELGKVYTVSGLTVNHGMPHVYVEGEIRDRLAEWRFDFFESQT